MPCNLKNFIAGGNFTESEKQMFEEMSWISAVNLQVFVHSGASYLFL